MPAKKKSESTGPASEIDFEDALQKIEQIVESMEDGQLPLETLVNQYQQGSALIKHCESLLSAARERIEFITLANTDSPETQPQQPSATDLNNDITLF